jgi:peroxiredoxin Q/BCP
MNRKPHAPALRAETDGVRAAMRRALAGVTAMLLAAVACGAPPADFTVTSPDGKTFRLSDARGRLAALHFLLKTECPYCVQQVQEYWQRAAGVAGVVHVFLKPDADDDIRAFSDKLDLPDGAPTIYRDADAKLAGDYGIAGRYEFHGQNMHYPALILLDAGGRELFRYVGKSNRDRLSFDDFAARVAEQTRNPELAHYNLGEDGVALGGYDPVAYFEKQQAVAGSKSIASTFRGVTYWFADAAARQRFANDPEKFLPTYGGWCATAMADGRKVEIDPKNFKLAGGRLFLFYRSWLGDAQKDWNKDESTLMRRADEQWRRIAPRDAIAMEARR